MEYERCGGILKIQKQSAKRLFDMGMSILLCPCNVKPKIGKGELYKMPFCMDSHMILVDNVYYGKSFEKIVERFESNKCTSAELGKYASFYINDVQGVSIKFVKTGKTQVHYCDINTVLDIIETYKKDNEVVITRFEDIIYCAILDKRLNEK